MAHLTVLGVKDADPKLRAVYERMRDRPMPAVYRAPHGDAPGIIRAHSLDPDLIVLTFAGMSASLAQGDAMTWAQRELVNTVTSRANQCFY